MLWFFPIFAILIILLFIKISKPLSYWKSKGIPYVKPWPIVGNLGRFAFRKRALVHLIRDLYNSSPNQRYVGGYLFLRPTLFVRDPELVKEITVTEFHHFSDHKPFTPNSEYDPLSSRNLFSLNYADGWHDIRAIISPAFTSCKMRNLFKLINTSVDTLTDYFEQDGITIFDVKDIFKRFTNDVIGTCAFGISSNSLKYPENEFYLMTRDITNFSGLRILKFFAFTISPTLMKLFKIPILNMKFNDFFIKIIKDTIKKREEMQIVRPDMIHLLMEARKGRLENEKHSDVVDSGFAVVKETKLESIQANSVDISDVDIAALAVTYLFAGTDTLATILCFGFYELATHMEVQVKLRKEINEEWKDELTYECLLGMKYLDCVISETLRKWTPGIAHDRICVNPYVIKPKLPGEKPLYVEKGTVVWILSTGIHYDPEYFPNPEEFVPERFSDENRHNIKSCTFIPFGYGPRACIGSRFALLEIKLVVAKIIKMFEIIPVENTQIPIKLCKSSVFPAPDGKLFLGLKPIVNASPNENI